MPTYLHSCNDTNCAHEWEADYSIKSDPPKVCPKCNQETAQRLINCHAKGVVELTGQDLVDSVKAGGKQLERDASRSEGLYANLLGENKYHQMQSNMDRAKRERR